MQSILKLVRFETVCAATFTACQSNDMWRLRFEGDPSDFGIEAPIRRIVFRALTTSRLHRLEVCKAARTIYVLDSVSERGRSLTAAGEMLYAMSIYSADSQLQADISGEAVRLREVVVLIDLVDPVATDLDLLVVMATD